MFKPLLDLDARLSTRLRVAERPGVVRNFAALLAHSGDSWFWLVGLGVLWYWGTNYWKARAVMLIIAILVTAVIVMTIKFSVRRRRPEGEWGGIYRSTDPHSFPSGHAARAALIAVMLMGMGPAWLGLAMAIWALSVVLARVAMGVHYLSDVLVGAVLGVFMGLAGLYFF